MCRHCRHVFDSGPLVKNYWLRFNGNKKEALKAISKRIHDVKRERKILQNKNDFEKIPYLDYERDALHFAAWVLNVNYEQNKGWKPGGWMNGADDFHPERLFVA